MSWLNVNIEEVENEIEQINNNKFGVEPGAYEGQIAEIFVDETKTGAKFLNVVFVTGSFPNDKEISFIGWDVNRMLVNKEGNPKNSKGRYFTGVILLTKIAKCFNKNINELKPVEKLVEVFGQSKKVKSFNELIGKTLVFGVRDKKYWNQDGDEKTKFDLVDICCRDDKECVDKLTKRIEKKPLVEDDSNKPSSNNQEQTTMPF